MESYTSQEITLNQQSSKNSLIPMWADNVTGLDTQNRQMMIHSKEKALQDFISFSGKDPIDCNAFEVKAYLDHLRNLISERGKPLSENYIYKQMTSLSSFYSWLSKSTGKQFNPATPVMPDPPRKFASESTKALDSKQLRDMLAKAKQKSVRDWLLLALYFYTGFRRREVAQLKVKDIYIANESRIIVTTITKGGASVNREITEPTICSALSVFIAGKDPESAVWLNSKGKPITTHGIAFRLKMYSDSKFHLHKTRHTYARLLSDAGASMNEIQEALGHSDIRTTRLYIQKIGIKKDKFGKEIAKEIFSETEKP